MAREQKIPFYIGPYHVTARSINKEWFNIPMNRVWEIFTHQLYFAKHAFNLDLHSFVLMHNHYHLIVSTPDLNLPAAMAYFHREVSWQLNRDGNRINRTFAGRYFKSYLGTDHYFVNCYKYVYQNPVRAQLIDRVEAYPYSSLKGLIGHQKLILPMAEDTLLFDGDLDETLTWLNTPIQADHLEFMRRGLKHKVFKLAKNPVTKRGNRVEFLKI